MKKLIAGMCAVILALTICAMVAWASPALGVTPTVIGRARCDDTGSCQQFEPLPHERPPGVDSV